MNLYLLSQTERKGLDTYDSCVVCAENEQEAKKIMPSLDFDEYQETYWASCAENIQCVKIGIADESIKKGLVIASFKAG